MLTIKQITENTEAVIRGLEKKHFKNAKETIDQVIALNDKRRTTQNQLDKNLAEVNSLSRTIGQLMKEGKKEEAESARARVAELKEGNKELDAVMTQAATEMQNVLYTIPAISLLGILIPFSGIGNKTAVIALTVYGIMPMVHNTYVGLTTLDPDILEAARGMGSTGTQALFRVKLPMAAGVILAGVRNMVVMTISVAGIASFVGAGGLGVAIYRGITIYNPAMTAAGSILIALLAIVCDLTLGALERYFKKRGS